MPPFLSDAYARIDHSVQDVGDQVTRQGQHRQEGQIEHGEGNVAANHGVIGSVADTGNTEQGLGDQSTREQAGQRAADDGDQGDQGVAEGVMINDLALAEALGAGGTDIVGVEYFQMLVRV